MPKSGSRKKGRRSGRLTMSTHGGLYYSASDTLAHDISSGSAFEKFSAAAFGLITNRPGKVTQVKVTVAVPFDSTPITGYIQVYGPSSGEPIATSPKRMLQPTKSTCFHLKIPKSTDRGIWSGDESVVVYTVIPPPGATGNINHTIQAEVFASYGAKAT